MKSSLKAEEQNPIAEKSIKAVVAPLKISPQMQSRKTYGKQWDKRMNMDNED